MEGCYFPASVVIASESCFEKNLLYNTFRSTKCFSGILSIFACTSVCLSQVVTHASVKMRPFAVAC